MTFSQIDEDQNFKKKLKWIFAGLTFILALIIVGTALSPFYFTHETSIEQADVVIVLVGADDNAKMRKAFRLIASGYARHLLIPGKGYTCDTLINPCFKINQKELRYINNSYVPETIPSLLENLPRYYERTHLELILARQMMEAQGLNSAIIVSHPYHMRRIKMIATTVFDNTSFRVHYVPAGDAYPTNKFGLLNALHWQWVFSEYMKIVWFKLYDRF